MELFGRFIPTQTLFFIFIVVIGILMLVYFRNRKYNLALLTIVSKELEAALQPTDQTYTWIGGTVGFKAEYQTPNPLRKAEATATMLSRQSLLFYPISKVLLGNDRLFVVIYPTERFRREAHIIERWYYRLRLQTLENEADFIRKTVTVRNKTFDLFSSDNAGIEKLSAWLTRLPNPELIKHVAFVPENGSVYLYMIPKPDAITQTVSTMTRLTAGK
ncbi:hypothetical membrane protein, conserved [Candidatus Moduliflexus flocculans]|uniref:Hypothetical membrane protein, conserved n=1 Tax=Candidatus Moduliflexus flocculans TaxID=1499966 RepID=A0A081BNN6_9BACT|nr:hypothetical membrane protein, conserved [Candidatus Moduliflexus flocculans]